MEDQNSINGKRILFLAPAFFGYEYKIKNKMEEMGATVDFFNERSIVKAFERALLKVAPILFNKKTSRYFYKIFQECMDINYDYILIIKCDMITEYILEKMHLYYPKACFCLYLYDSVCNIKGIRDKFKYFDRIFSFDKSDTLKYNNIKFRPLFYIDDFKKNIKENSNYKYDVAFCGTIHSDRYAIIKKVVDICNSEKLSMCNYCYLQSRFIYYFYRVTKSEFKDARKDDFAFEKLSSKEISKIVDESRIILDIQHPKQTGLTMRTIEMLGMNKKLITTNKSIKEYNFYNPNNILIVDRKNIQISSEFISLKYEKINDNIYEKYSLENWVKEILY